MNGTSRSLNWILAVGVASAALTGLCFALNLTAVPVVMDVPLATLVIATLAVTMLLVGVLRECRIATGAKRARLGLGGAALLVVLILAWLSVQARFMAYRADEAHFSNGGVELAGTLYSPRSRGPHPAVVLVHGSGPETRKEYAYFAKLFARNNFTALAYDKRGVGESSGKLYESDYQDYADDVLSAVEYLRARMKSILAASG